MIPSQFGDSLEQFAKAFAHKDEDGVFRYEAEGVSEETRELAGQEDTDRWFDTSQDPELAKALAEARAVANKHVDDPDPTTQTEAEATRSARAAGDAQRALESQRRELATGSEAASKPVSEPVSRPVTPQEQPEPRPE